MPLATRFRLIDDSNRDDHFRLDQSDECAFLNEYTSGQRWDFSEVNQLISNLKKSPLKKNRPAEYRYKLDAIQNCAAALAQAIDPTWFQYGTIVPVPPSKAKLDPEYDDRLICICNLLKIVEANLLKAVDARKIVYQEHSMDATHLSGGGPRHSVDDLVANYRIDEGLTSPAPTDIAVLDDVLTVGTHFKAMQTILSARFPGVPIRGIFIARRVFLNPFAGISIPPPRP